MIPLMIDDRYETMPWDAIDAVVFDVGNVLLAFDPPAILRDILPDKPEVYDRLLVKVFRSPYWVMMDHGLCEPAEAAEAMAIGVPELAGDIRRVTTEWAEMKRKIPEGIAALEACRACGKKTYVLSNYGNSTFAVIEERHRFFDGFDGKVVSSRVGLMKPDPEIFGYIERKYGLNPGRTLFIDDSPANIEMALSLGWQGFCLNETGRLTRFMGLAE